MYSSYLEKNSDPFARYTHGDTFAWQEARAFEVCLTEYKPCYGLLQFMNSPILPPQVKQEIFHHE